MKRRFRIADVSESGPVWVRQVLNPGLTLTPLSVYDEELRTSHFSIDE